MIIWLRLRFVILGSELKGTNLHPLGSDNLNEGTSYVLDMCNFNVFSSWYHGHTLVMYFEKIISMYSLLTHWIYVYFALIPPI